MDSKNYTQVLIDGKVYTLGGSEDESYLQKAASYVNEKNNVMRKVPGFAKQSADYQMVMTELNIADDYFKAMERADEMEYQKDDMERETYSLKHELVSTQMKLEAVLRDLEERQMELNRQSRRSAELEGELKEARESLQEFRNKPAPEPKRTISEDAVPKRTAGIQEAGGIKESTSRRMSASALEAAAASMSALTVESATTPGDALTPSAAQTPQAAPSAAQTPQAAPSAAQTPQAAPSVAPVPPVTPPAASAQPVTLSAAPASPAPMPTSAAVSAPRGAAMPEAPSFAGGISDEDLARKALQAARKAGSHKGGRR